MGEAWQPAPPHLVKTLEKALAEENPLILPVYFRIDVLRKYRDEGATLVRTDNVGRLLVLGRFAVDFGLVADHGLIHLSFGDLLHKVPAAERPHWLAHLAAPPTSDKFLRMRIRPACTEDGELRELELP